MNFLGANYTLPKIRAELWDIIIYFFKHVRYLNHEKGYDYARGTCRVRSRLRIETQEGITFTEWEEEDLTKKTEI